eukprot:gene61881-biopygen31434
MAQTVNIYAPLTAVNQGLGECNNVISKATVFDPRLGYQAIDGVVNEGRRQRMQSTSYDPISAGNPFTPQAETEYISSPERTILYNDVVQYVLPNISQNASVNSLITSGIARLRGFLMVPIINAASNVCGLD